MHTVGVAPGTTTLQLGNVWPGVAAKSINWIPQWPCPPEEKRWFMPERASDEIRPSSWPNGFAGTRVHFDPYQRDVWQMRGGLRGLRGPVRWDLIGIVGGGAFAVALITSLIASGLR